MNIKYLSSRTTIIYKFFIPLLFLLLLLTLTIGMFTFLPEKHMSLYIAFEFFLIFCFIIQIPLLYLKKVYYTDTNLYIDNYKKITKLKFDQIKEINSFGFYFYKLTYFDRNSSKSIIFVPHILEKMTAIMGTPISIKEFRNNIFHSI